MEITRVDPEDDALVAAAITVSNATRAADAPWTHPLTPRRVRGSLVHGWDGEPATAYVGTVGETPVATGSISASRRDNLHLAWLGVEVHPDHRRTGLGAEVLAHLVELARGDGRTTLRIDGWDSPATLGFAQSQGFEQKSVSVNRRQHLAEVDWSGVERLHVEAQAHAASYELMRWVGRTPEELLESAAVMANAINDAPTDDLDIEDEVQTPERVRAYEDARLGRGELLHQVVARHRDTGDLAGHTVVSVDGEDPTWGEQHDTAVVATHRGHRLGTLLKADMVLWLRETRPLLVSVDTWNAESNGYMIDVNEALGYRVMGRQLEFQRAV